METLGAEELSTAGSHDPYIKYPRPPGRQSGFALIGVMIGVVIFFGGVMGIAAMHSQAVRANHDSLQRSQAVWLAHDIAERIKVNFSETKTYETEFSNANTDVDAYCLTPPSPQCTAGTTCTSEEIARFDVFDLLCNRGNRDYIINPFLGVSCSTAGVAGACGLGERVSITISWDSRGIVGGSLRRWWGLGIVQY